MVVFATLVYGITYGIQPHSYALIGIANAIAMASPEELYEQECEEEWQGKPIACAAESTEWV